MIGHKISFTKFKKIEIISSIFSDHHDMKLEINYNKKKNPENHSDTWKLNSTLLNNECVHNEIKEEIKSYLETKK